MNVMKLNNIRPYYFNLLYQCLSSFCRIQTMPIKQACHYPMPINVPFCTNLNCF